MIHDPYDSWDPPAVDITPTPPLERVYDDDVTPDPPRRHVGFAPAPIQEPPKAPRRTFLARVKRRRTR